MRKRKGYPLPLFLPLLALMSGNRKLAQYNQLGSNNRLPKSPIKSALLSAVERVEIDATISALNNCYITYR
jgi:hypothetical protein